MLFCVEPMAPNKDAIEFDRAVRLIKSIIMDDDINDVLEYLIFEYTEFAKNIAFDVFVQNQINSGALTQKDYYI